MDDERSEDEALVIPINRALTDGDPSTWPQEDKYDRPDDSLYREKLAVMWLKQMGAYEEGLCIRSRRGWMVADKRQEWIISWMAYRKDTRCLIDRV